MYLDQTIEKLSYRVLSIVDGRSVKLKLYSMGLYPEVVIRIVKNDRVGPLILAINASRVSVGRDLAKKINVEVL